MHAHDIVQRFINTQLTCIHAARGVVLAAAVTALMQGHPLTLSRLARGIIGVTGLKAALKRIDRLVGARSRGKVRGTARQCNRPEPRTRDNAL